MSSVNFKWLTKADFRGKFKMHDNINEDDIDIAVNDAYLFDVLPTLPDELMADIQDILKINPIQWVATKSYTVGDKVFYDGVYYSCVNANNNSQPSGSNTDWAEIKLMTFWTNFVKPYFECCAYYRFLLWHGANVAQFGLRQNQEETSQELSDKRKGELLADISGKKDIYLARLTKEFANSGNKFDSITYVFDSDDTQKLNQGIRVWGVGKTSKKHISKRRCCDDEFPLT